MTEPLKPCQEEIEYLHKHIGKDYLNNKQRIEIESAHSALAVLEEYIRTQQAPSPMRDEDVSGALNTLDRLYKRLPDLNMTSYEENRALYEGLRNWISEQGLLRAKGV